VEAQKGSETTLLGLAAASGALAAAVADLEGRGGDAEPGAAAAALPGVATVGWAAALAGALSRAARSSVQLGAASNAAAPQDGIRAFRAAAELVSCGVTFSARAEGRGTSSTRVEGVHFWAELVLMRSL